MMLSRSFIRVWPGIIFCWLFLSRLIAFWLIERSDQMYGGTCINVGCLPSKNMIINGQRHLEFADAVAKRGTMTKQLRNKNYHMVADEPLATVWNGQASFVSNHELKVAMADETV